MPRDRDYVSTDTRRRLEVSGSGVGTRFFLDLVFPATPLEEWREDSCAESGDV